MLEKGQLISHVYLVKSGCVYKETSGVNTRRLIVGDLFGERMLLGRSKSEARYTAEDEVELFQLSPNHLTAGYFSLILVLIFFCLFDFFFFFFFFFLSFLCQCGKRILTQIWPFGVILL